MRIVFFHGWGFDRNFWYPTMNELGESNTFVLDQGYFEPSEKSRMRVDRPWIGVGHSAGFQSLLQLDLSHCRGLIALNGFTRFVQGLDFVHGIPERVLKRMMARFDIAPVNVLEDFFYKIGAAPPIIPHLERERLALGLQKLAMDDHRVEAESLRHKISWLAGTHDPLLSATLVDACFQHMPHGYFVEGGHLLPLTNPARCAAFIHESLSRFKTLSKT